MADFDVDAAVNSVRAAPPTEQQQTETPTQTPSQSGFDVDAVVSKLRSESPSTPPQPAATSPGNFDVDALVSRLKGGGAAAQNTDVSESEQHSYIDEHASSPDDPFYKKAWNWANTPLTRQFGIRDYNPDDPGWARALEKLGSGFTSPLSLALTIGTFGTAGFLESAGAAALREAGEAAGLTEAEIAAQIADTAKASKAVLDSTKLGLDAAPKISETVAKAGVDPGQYLANMETLYKAGLREADLQPGKMLEKGSSILFRKFGASPADAQKLSRGLQFAINAGFTVQQLQPAMESSARVHDLMKDLGDPNLTDEERTATKDQLGEAVVQAVTGVGFGVLGLTHALTSAGETFHPSAKPRLTDEYQSLVRTFNKRDLQYDIANKNATDLWAENLKKLGYKPSTALLTTKAEQALQNKRLAALYENYTHGGDPEKIRQSYNALALGFGREADLIPGSAGQAPIDLSTPEGIRATIGTELDNSHLPDNLHTLVTEARARFTPDKLSKSQTREIENTLGALRTAYEDARSDRLTPAEKDVLANLRQTLDNGLDKANAAGVLGQGIENYMRRMWDAPETGPANQTIQNAGLGKFAVNAPMARKRVFQTEVEGLLKGYKLKSRDPIGLTAQWTADMDKVLANRALMADLISNYTQASDHLPAMVQYGTGHVVEGEDGQNPATYINPNGVRDLNIDPKIVATLKANGLFDRFLNSGDLVERNSKITPENVGYYIKKIKEHIAKTTPSGAPQPVAPAENLTPQELEAPIRVKPAEGTEEESPKPDFRTKAGPETTAEGTEEEYFKRADWRKPFGNTPKPKRAADEVQEDIDGLENTLEKQGVNISRLYLPTKYNKEVFADSPEWSSMPKELADLYQERARSYNYNDDQLNKGVDDRLRSAVPDDMERRKLVVAITETDKPHAIRSGVEKGSQIYDLGRAANEIVQHVAKNVTHEPEERFEKVDALLGGTAENPGVVLRRTGVPQGYRPYSEETYEEAQKILNALMENSAPEYPRRITGAYNRTTPPQKQPSQKPAEPVTSQAQTSRKAAAQSIRLVPQLRDTEAYGDADYDPFLVVDGAGNRLGHLEIYPPGSEKMQDAKTLEANFVSDPDKGAVAYRTGEELKEYGPVVRIAPQAIRALLPELAERYPNADAISAIRIHGAKHNPDDLNQGSGQKLKASFNLAQVRASRRITENPQLAEKPSVETKQTKPTKAEEPSSRKTPSQKQPAQKPVEPVTSPKTPKPKVESEEVKPTTEPIIAGRMPSGFLARDLPIMEKVNRGELPPEALDDVNANRTPSYAWRPRNYISLDHPAFRNWRFRTSDPMGNDIWVNTELKAHPEYADYIKNRLGISDKDSYVRKNPILNTALKTGGKIKTVILSGSPFHLIQEGIRGMMTGVSPFGNMGYDLGPETGPLTRNQYILRQTVEHGMTLTPEWKAQQASMEGVAEHAKALEKVPFIGHAFDSFHDYLFRRYIPGLKARAAIRLYDRYSAAHPDWTPEQVSKMTATHANNAFGGQNWRALGRTAATQDWFRLLSLAPDWLESEVRFVHQLFGGSGDVTRAQFAKTAMALWGTARVLNMLHTGDMHLEAPFGVVHKDKDGREIVYSVRTAPTDMFHMATDPVGFLKGRASPLVADAVEIASGRNKYGEKVPVGQTWVDAFRQSFPIPAQELFAKPGGFSQSVRTPQQIYKASIGTASVYKTEAQKLAAEFARTHSEEGPMTQQETQRHVFMNQLADGLRNGDTQISDLDRLVGQGAMTEADKHKLLDNARKTVGFSPENARLYVEVSRLTGKSAPQFLAVWDKATPKEQTMLHPLLAKVRQSYRKYLLTEVPPTKREGDATMQRLNDMLSY